MLTRGILGALGALMTLAVLAGCTTATPSAKPVIAASGSDLVGKISVGGLERTYLIHIPADASAENPLPLLVMFHGAGGDGARAEVTTGFTTDSNDNDFIVAYPNGTAANSIEGELAWNAGNCCGLPRGRNVDDVGFISAMLAQIEGKYAVDTSRVYLAGFSNGGMMTYRLACQLPGTFAAIAVVSGALNYKDCATDTPLPVLIVHGRADQTVPYDGGETNPRTASRFGQWTNSSVVYSTNFWLKADGCDDDPVITKDETTSTDSYDDCEDGGTVEVVSVTNGTHVWPRIETLGVDASGLILKFFGLV